MLFVCVDLFRIVYYSSYFLLCTDGIIRSIYSLPFVSVHDSVLKCNASCRNICLTFYILLFLCKACSKNHVNQSVSHACMLTKLDFCGFMSNSLYRVSTGLLKRVLLLQVVTCRIPFESAYKQIWRPLNNGCAEERFYHCH